MTLQDSTIQQRQLEQESIAFQPYGDLKKVSYVSLAMLALFVLVVIKVTK